MPSDSHFAIALKTQQEAERAEQQRIKNLVLNYDLQGSASPDASGTDKDLYFDYFSTPNPNHPSLLEPLPNGRSKGQNENTIAHKPSSKGLTGDRHQHNASLHQSRNEAPTSTNARPTGGEKPAGGRRGQQARKLQLSDVDWYDRRSHSSTSSSVDQGQNSGQDHSRSHVNGSRRERTG